MNIHYYEIKNCYLGESCGQPVIFPPKDADRNTLTKCGFVQLTDSEEWCHFLSDEEYQYIMQFSKEEDVTFEGDKYENPKDKYDRAADNMAMLSILFMIIGVVGTLGEFFDHFGISLGHFLFGIVSFVLAVALEIQFPEKKRGKVLIVINSILFLLFFVIFVFALLHAVDSCINSCYENAQRCCAMG